MPSNLRQFSKKPVSLILTILFGAVFILQACSGGAPVSTQPGGTPAGVAAGEPTGVLRVAMQPIVQIDPAFISSDPEVLVASSVYDYLVDITAQNTIVPRLAREWSVSEDGLTYVITLVENATFHDGTPLNSEDVVWTFNRLRDPNIGSGASDLFSNIANVEATGDYEVTFTLSEPNPFFLYDLSDNRALILATDTEDAATTFNGSGPFRVAGYSPESDIQLEANPDYFQSGKPGLAGIEITFFNDQTAQVEALRSGQIDLVMFLSTDLFVGLQNEPGLIPVQVDTNGFDLVRLRSDRAPGDDPRVTQALRLATDREAIYDLVLQGYGAIGRDSPIGPMYTEYYSEETPLPERDIEAARQLLSEAGYEGGLDLELHTPDTGNRPNLAAVLKDQWAEVGVNVEVVVEPESVYYGDDGWLEVDLGITGWGSRPYPQFYLDTMLVCDAIWNESHFCDDELDSLAQAAGTTMNEEERVDAYNQIQALLIERGPVIIPYFFATLGAISDQFQGFEMKPFPGRSDLAAVTTTGQ
jgi:peptide/nickel transport system substrate-binding protein